MDNTCQTKIIDSSTDDNDIDKSKICQVINTLNNYYGTKLEFKKIKKTTTKTEIFDKVNNGDVQKYFKPLVKFCQGKGTLK